VAAAALSFRLASPPRTGRSRPSWEGPAGGLPRADPHLERSPGTVEAVAEAAPAFLRELGRADSLRRRVGDDRARRDGDERSDRDQSMNGHLQPPGPGVVEVLGPDGVAGAKQQLRATYGSTGVASAPHGGEPGVPEPAASAPAWPGTPWLLGSLNDEVDLTLTDVKIVQTVEGTDRTGIARRPGGIVHAGVVAHLELVKQPTEPPDAR
jgi:hypothetical protein